ncbi:hypothetical protein LXL04_018704 [Taraxacum kok-saghyz]
MLRRIAHRRFHDLFPVFHRRIAQGRFLQKAVELLWIHTKGCNCYGFIQKAVELELQNDNQSLLIFPIGNNVDHLSMYLDVVDSSTLPYGWSRYAQFNLGVVNQAHNKLTIRKDTQHQFNSRESDWGFTSFMPLSELYDPSRGYLLNDKCIVEADVAVRKELNLFLCEKLEDKMKDAKKGVLFIDFPPVLQLQLKRFEFDFVHIFDVFSTIPIHKQLLAKKCQYLIIWVQGMESHCKSKDDLINAIFPSLQINGGSSDYIISRSILSTKNENVDEINDQLIDRFIGEQRVYYSFDEAEDDKNNFYPMEFLNSLNVSGLPPHYLRLKIGCPIILLRNIDPSNGLCNGTRLICKGFQMNVIDAEIAVGHHAGKRVFLPRIPLCPSADDMFPFKLKRKQFPIRLSFAMTINKAQGQTIPNVGVYLPESVFSHGQLYVALSRGISRENTKVLVKPVKEFTNEGVYTSNVVYREVLHDI